MAMVRRTVEPARPRKAEVPRALMDARLNLTFSLERILGKGGFGKVFAARDTSEGRQFAIKAMRQSVRTPDVQRAAISREIALQRSCLHELICALYSAFSDDMFSYLVLEFCGHGSVQQLLRKRGALTEPEVRVYLGQAAAALRFLHDERDIVHRDLTATNLLLTTSMTLKIADFGLARRADDPQLFTTRGYSIRQLFQSVFAFMLTGAHPFDSAAPTEELHGSIRMFVGPTLPLTVSKAATELAHRMMRPRFANRMRAAAILRHVFLTDRRADVVLLTADHLQREPHGWELVVAGRPSSWNVSEQACGGATGCPGAGASLLPVSFDAPSADFPLALLSWCDGAIGRAIAQGGARVCVELTGMSEPAEMATCRVRKWSSTFGERPHGVLFGDGALTALFPDNSTLTISGDRAVYLYAECGDKATIWPFDARPPTKDMAEKLDDLARLTLALNGEDMPPIGRQWDPFGERLAKPELRPTLRLLQCLPTGAAVCTFSDKSVQALFPDSNHHFLLQPQPTKGTDELWVKLAAANQRVWWLALQQRTDADRAVTAMTDECMEAFVELRASLGVLLS